MRLLSWLVMVPVAAAVVAFAVANRETVNIDLWPAPYEVTAPLFAVVLLSLLVGLVVGAVISWGSSLGVRHRARAMARRAERAERELETLRRKEAARHEESAAEERAVAALPAADESGRLGA